MTLKLSSRQLKDIQRYLPKKIAEFVANAGADGVVVAFSGGLDSAVVLALAERSGVDVRALILPEEGVNDPQDAEDAQAYAKKLNVSYEVIRINKIIDSIQKAFPWSKFPEKNKKIAYANIKPRVRMILDYLTANLDGRIVLGTSNKTELSLGYFTKYGDGEVDVLPIGGLYKTQVRQLAEVLGVPKEIRAKTPSAGLWRGQTDEKEIGLSYEELDDILYYLMDERKTIEDVCELAGVEKDKVQSVVTRIEKNRHKRTCPPILEPPL